MSIHTGRMSRRDAKTALTAARSTAADLGRPEWVALADSLYPSAEIAGGYDARAIRALVADVNEAAWQRLERSQATPPTVSRAVTVTLYGVQSAALAFDVAAQSLGVDPGDLTMVDREPISTPEVIGVRFTLRVV